MSFWKCVFQVFSCFPALLAGISQKSYLVFLKVICLFLAFEAFWGLYFLANPGLPDLLLVSSLVSERMSSQQQLLGALEGPAWDVFFFFIFCFSVLGLLVLGLFVLFFLSLLPGLEDFLNDPWPM